MLRCSHASFRIKTPELNMPHTESTESTHSTAVVGFLHRLRWAEPTAQSCCRTTACRPPFCRGHPPSPGTGEGLRSKAQGEGAKAEDARRAPDRTTNGG